MLQSGDELVFERTHEQVYTCHIRRVYGPVLYLVCGNMRDISSL